MSAVTNIGWCDSTVNPTTGCDGCELFSPQSRKKATCYALAIHEGRLAKSRPDLYDADFQRVRLAPGRMAQAAGWPDLYGQARDGKPWLDGKPRFVFVGDMGDVFSRQVPDHYLADEVFAHMRTTEGKRHFWVVLTKRPQRMAEFSKGIEWPDNCIAMTSVTDQRTAEARIPHLLATKCKLSGISAEPLLGPVNLGLQTINREAMLRGPDAGYPSMQWLIVGGESGPRRRDCGARTIEAAAEQGPPAGVPTFVKQDCALRDGERGRLSAGHWALKQVPALSGFERYQQPAFI